MVTFRQTRTGELIWVTNPNDRYIGKSLEVYGEWSFGEIMLLSAHLSPGDHVIEVGANIGAHAVPLAKHIHPGRLFTFEPQRLCFQMLCANLINNGCTNAMTTNAAVGDNPGTANIVTQDYEARGNFGAAHIDTNAVSSSGLETVSVVRLDDVIPADSKIALIKCDAEGMEADVIAGAHALITRDRPILYLEDDRPSHSERLFRVVKDLGYDVWWHAVPLFRPDNAAKTAENIFANVYSMSLFCTHPDSGIAPEGLQKIERIEGHPTRDRH